MSENLLTPSTHLLAGAPDGAWPKIQLDARTEATSVG